MMKHLAAKAPSADRVLVAITAAVQIRTFERRIALARANVELQRQSPENG